MTSTSPRLPEFVVIGTMKSGTTTLFRWLDGHPRVRMPAIKEPNYFCDPKRFEAGIDDYAKLFEGIPRTFLTGEASIRYTDPSLAEETAERLHRTIPDALLVCLLRHPVERLRSHYRHEVQRGRERRKFDAAVTPDSSYTRRSCYAEGLAPWLAWFPRRRLHVTTFEAMFTDEGEWRALLDFLGLEPVPVPVSIHNVTRDKEAFSPVMRLLWDSGLAQRLPRPPLAVRRVVRPLFLREPEVNDDLVRTASRPVGADVMDRLTADHRRLRAMLPELRLDWRVEQ